MIGSNPISGIHKGEKYINIQKGGIKSELATGKVAQSNNFVDGPASPQFD